MQQNAVAGRFGTVATRGVGLFARTDGAGEPIRAPVLSAYAGIAMPSFATDCREEPNVSSGALG